MSITILNDNNVCRTCLSPTNLRPLYAKSPTDSLSTMLQTCTAMTYQETDGLPIQICVKCITKLKQAYDFIHKCHVTEKQLRAFAKLYAQQPQPGLKDPLAITEPVPIKTEIINHVKTESTNAEAPNQHLNDNHEKVHQCNTCPASFDSLLSLISHKNVHNEPVRPFLCTICNIAFQGRIHLNNHLRIHAREPQNREPSNQNANSRTVCDESFRVKPAQRNETLFNCVVCSDTFAELAELKLHIRHEHSYICERPYSCESCDAVFKTASCLKNHTFTHTGAMHVCSLCKRSFTLKYHLNKHMIVHTGEKPFACSICKCNFRCKASIARHLRKRNGDNKSCDICKQTFCLSSQLIRHSRLHE